MHGVQQCVDVIALAAFGARDGPHQIDFAVFAEIFAGTAGLRVHADQIPVARAPVNTLVIRLAVSPVGHAALIPHSGHRRRAIFIALRIVDPQRLARFRVEGHPDRKGRVQEEAAAHHKRRRLEITHARMPVAAPQPRGLRLKFIEDIA